jgi:hypothetical protein
VSIATPNMAAKATTAAMRKDRMDAGGIRVSPND